MSQLVPWFEYTHRIRKVVLEDGITRIGQEAFSGCSLMEEISIPDSVTEIGGSAFSSCTGLREVYLPDSIQTFRGYGIFLGCTDLTTVRLPQGMTEVVLPEGISYLGGTFWNCVSLKQVNIPSSVTAMGYWAFRNCTSLESLTLPENLQAMGDAIFADSTISSLEFTGDAPVFTVAGGVTDYAYNNGIGVASMTALETPESLMAMADSGRAVIDQFGDAVGTFANLTATACYPGGNGTWTQDLLSGNYGGNITWEARETAANNRVTLPLSQLGNAASVWVDGVEYLLQGTGDSRYVDLPDGSSKTLITYSFQEGADAHATYPTGMQVWTLDRTSGGYQAIRQPELDNIMKYAGMSIRVSGKRGIRRITELEQQKKDALMAGTLAGFTLKEYGTVVAFASALDGGRPLTLEQSYAKSNFAYKQDVADPVFSSDGQILQYTNVLVGFSQDQCGQDIALRSYMILEDAAGRQVTLYGGTVVRSIGYIAYQNRTSFAPGTEAYEYVWTIIRSVYGAEFDGEYQK